MWIKTENFMDHNDGLACIDSYEDRQLYITGCSAGVVKIWSNKKDLIRSIRFPEEINSATFLNAEGDILVGHGDQISCILHENYGLPTLCCRSFEKHFEAFLKKNQLEITNELLMSIKMREDALKLQLKQEINKDIGVALVE